MAKRGKLSLPTGTVKAIPYRGGRTATARGILSSSGRSHRSGLTATLDTGRRPFLINIGCGIPVPAMSSALAYYDGYRTGRLPANLLQAQRDYFGAHTYERTDRPRGKFFHTNWTGRGGTTASTTYNV